jgi:hypothetical protein
MSLIGARWKLRIEKNPIRNPGQAWISFPQYRSAGFEHNLQEQIIDNRQLQIPNV